MKTLRGSFLCLVAILVLQLTTHFWWWILVVPFVYGALASSSGWEGFRSGMLGAGGLWFVAAGWQLTTSAQLVSQRVAEMLRVGSPGTVLAATMKLIISFNLMPVPNAPTTKNPSSATAADECASASPSIAKFIAINL